MSVAAGTPAGSARRAGPASRLSVAQWFALGVGVLLAATALGLIAGLLALARLSDRRGLLSDRLDPANLAALSLASALLNQETGVRGYVLGRRSTYLLPYERGRRAEAAALRRLEALQGRDDLAGVRADLSEVRRRAIAWQRDYAQPAIAAVRAGTPPPDPAVGKVRFDALRLSLTREQRGLERARATARAELADAGDLARTLLLAGGALVLLAVVASSLALRRAIIAPLARLAGEVRGVARGEFGRRLVPSGPREVVQLGEDVDAMRERIVRELTALRDAEQALLEQARELQRSNQELEQFAYVASHDLQEPLRKVASFTQMLERRYKGQLDERADQYIAFAVDGAKRMQVLINDLLEFSRVGRVTRPHERVQCAALVEQALARLSTAIAETGTQVSTGPLPAVSGDAVLLTSVFQNLVANAIKFRGEAPPRVRIEAERKDACWWFSCTDNGIGIEDQYAERIFAIFQRLHTREAYEGTGIGLAMCRKIIEYHGGHIELAPAAPGRGARFEFTLPALDEADPTEEK